MAFSKPINPKKKRKGNVNKDSPYPVPLETDRETGSWFYYTGYICNNYVQVKHTGDIERLHKMGFFGKGALSRSKPEFNQKYRTVEIPNNKGEIITARVMSRRSYLHRLRWDTGTEEEYHHFVDYDSAEEMITDTESKEKIQPETEESHKESKEPKHSWLDFSKMEVEKNTGSADESWEEDADFWGVGSLSEQNKDKVGSNRETQTTQAGSDNTGERKTESSRLNESNCQQINPEIHSVTNSDKCDTKDLHVFDQQDKISFLKNQKVDQSNSEGQTSSTSVTNTEDIEYASYLNSDSDNSEPMKTFGTEKVKVTVTEPFHENQFLKTSGFDEKSSETESEVDSFCKTDDGDGTLFVVDDSDSEPEYSMMSKRKRRKKKKWKPVLKRDPFFIKENLHLSFEEAFFLSFGLGCLVVKDENKVDQDILQMWRLFIDRQKTFIPHYVAYHYYRSKGWVPKTGLKFGSDLLIYKEGPAFYHGSYSVIVKMIDEGTLSDDPMFPSRELSWTSLAGLNRLTEQVAKEILLCFVIRPNSLSNEDLRSPKCIHQFKIKEMLLSRWVSSQEREKQHCEEVP